MNTYRNTNYTKRDYETTNVVACKADVAPGPAWELCDATILDGLSQLWLTAGVRYYGHL
jgi:hypothetical protein